MVAGQGAPHQHRDDQREHQDLLVGARPERAEGCLLYTSDAADERSSVDLGGRRIIKKKDKQQRRRAHVD